MCLFWLYVDVKRIVAITQDVSERCLSSADGNRLMQSELLLNRRGLSAGFLMDSAVLVVNSNDVYLLLQLGTRQLGAE